MKIAMYTVWFANRLPTQVGMIITCFTCQSHILFLTEDILEHLYIFYKLSKKIFKKKCFLS